MYDTIIILTEVNWTSRYIPASVCNAWIHYHQSRNTVRSAHYLSKSIPKQTDTCQDLSDPPEFCTQKKQILHAQKKNQQNSALENEMENVHSDNANFAQKKLQWHCKQTQVLHSENGNSPHAMESLLFHDFFHKIGQFCQVKNLCDHRILERLNYTKQIWQPGVKAALLQMHQR